MLPTLPRPESMTAWRWRQTFESSFHAGFVAHSIHASRDPAMV
jgi:hypothetical protein